MAIKNIYILMLRKVSGSKAMTEHILHVCRQNRLQKKYFLHGEMEIL
jgi:hypothetical protein